MIVLHEDIHVREKHTFDILFAEILFLLQWFNPFVWLLKDAIKNNLEYKTDHQVVKNNRSAAIPTGHGWIGAQRGNCAVFNRHERIATKKPYSYDEKENQKQICFAQAVVSTSVIGSSNNEFGKQGK